MAGEWIPIDCCLPQKPEFLEIQDATGAAVDQVHGRLGLFWGWAALNSADGTLRATPATLARVCGGDESFWRAVENVGWISFCNETRTVRIAGWDERFSKAAKARLVERRRSAERRAAKHGENNDPGSDAGREPVETRSESGREPVEIRSVAGLDRGDRGDRGEEIEIHPSGVVTTETPEPRRSRSRPADSIRWTPTAGWEGIEDADRAAWREAYPACDVARELAAAGEWLRSNPEKSRKKRWRAFLTRWLSRSQEKGGGLPSNRAGRPDAPMTLDEKLERDRRESATKRSWRDAPPGCPDDLAGRFFNAMLNDAEYAANLAEARRVHAERVRQEAQAARQRLSGVPAGSPEPRPASGPEIERQEPGGASDDSEDGAEDWDYVRDGWVGRDGRP